MIRVVVAGRFSRNRMAWMLTRLSTDDLTTLAGWLASGELRSVIDRTVRLADVPDALAYLGTGRARGKIIVKM